ncbi:T9SS type A sorting domain-containing protein [Flavobacterium coralii]|uniref:T9SS type A sorting domain-containing protein n=1 Tax=Flavobacterium coralii TaxID=2838017 RepID=UPI000C55B39C|nr:hypothetical protein [Flavobacterium sp.]|tara:strand:+ start:49440 stop:52244 length:2805 start_codon:yes stop_codon:yes gene_type:complete
MKKKKIYVLFLLLGLTVSAQQGAIDNSFNAPDNGTYQQLIFNQFDDLSYVGSSPVYQPDGKILLLSQWESILYQFNPDGSIANAFELTDVMEEGQYLPYDRLYLQPDGKILLVYALEGGMLRLNADGTLDTTFTAPEFTDFGGYEGSIYDVAFQADGKLLVAGDFMKVNTIDKKRFVRLNNDGSLDDTLNIGNGFSDTTFSIAVQPDGKIIVVGAFAGYNNSPSGHIVRINPDGSKDTSFALTPGSNFYYEGLARGVKVLPSGKILVNGTSDLYLYNSQFKKGLIRLNSNGSYDTTFNAQPFTNSLTEGEIEHLTVQPDGKILVNVGGGNYESGLNNYYRLNESGSLDQSFNSSMQFDGMILRLVLQDDGKVIVGGSYYNEDTGVTRNIIHRVNADGSLDLSFMPYTGTNGQVFRSFLQNDGKILLIGEFTTYNDHYAPHMARIDLNGNLDTAFTFDTAVSVPHSPYHEYPLMQEQADGKILIAGDGYKVDDVEKNMFRVNTDGSLDASFNYEDGRIIHFIILPDGKILAAGSTGSFKDGNTYKLLRLNADGTIDTTYSSYIFKGIPESLELLPDGKILVGGSEFNSSNYLIPNLMRLNPDGTVDSSFLFTSPNTFPIKILRTLTQPDGKILYTYENTYASSTNIGRLNQDGTVDPSFTDNYGTGITENTGFKNIILQEDGSILLTTLSGMFNYEESSRLVKLNPDGTWDTTFEVPGDGYVNFYMLAGCDRLITTGNFATFGTAPKNNIAAVNVSDSPVPPSGDSTQYFSNGETLGDLVADGDNIIWYSEPSACEDTYVPSYTARTSQEILNTPLPASTPLVDGTTYYATQTVNGEESKFTLAVTALLEGTAGVEVVEASVIKAYPNPTGGLLTLESPSVIGQVTIYNAIGQLVHTQNINAITGDVDLSGFNSGLYIVTVASEDKVSTLKIFKK